MAQYVYVTIATKIVVKKTGHYYFGGMEYTMEQIREKLENTFNLSLYNIYENSEYVGFVMKPEIIKQGSRYGVKLKAKAPSIHMIKVDVESTFEPIIGSELQSKELINYLTKDTNSENIWKSEIFGRSLDAIVQEGIQAKLSLMPDNLRYKLQSTLCKVVNKGSNNMIAIVL